MEHAGIDLIYSRIVHNATCMVLHTSTTVLSTTDSLVLQVPIAERGQFECRHPSRAVLAGGGEPSVQRHHLVSHQH